MSSPPDVSFGVIGLNHPHIYGMTQAILAAGGNLAAFYSPEDELAKAYVEAFPQARRAADRREILEHRDIRLVLTAAVPPERAAIGIAAMRHGKDVLSDKPGFTTLEQLSEAQAVQAETKRLYLVFYVERLDEPATVHAGELVRAGAIGRVVQTIGVGPHRLNPHRRPHWFFRRALGGGIFLDIGADQMDQFLHFTGSTEARILFARRSNLVHAQYPEIDDFGEAVLSGSGGEGYMRLDWLAPDGMPRWGDGRVVILGSEGYIEVRKYVDLAGRDGMAHLLVVDRKGVRYVDCSAKPRPFGPLLLRDIADRTETAMSQAHCFLASRLSLEAQAMSRIGLPSGG